MLLSGRLVYDQNPLRHNLNPQKPVLGFGSCSWVGSNIDTPTYIHVCALAMGAIRVINYLFKLIYP